jgi:hypothetical protein
VDAAAIIIPMERREEKEGSFRSNEVSQCCRLHENPFICTQHMFTYKFHWQRIGPMRDCDFRLSRCDGWPHSIVPPRFPIVPIVCSAKLVENAGSGGETSTSTISPRSKSYCNSTQNCSTRNSPMRYSGLSRFK